MAKRELITKEDALMALTGCFELGVTLNKYSASCQKHIEAIKPITEQEIVRPYLTKLRSDIVASIEDIKGKYDNTVPEHDRPLCKCARNEARLEIIEWIDGLLAELGLTVKLLKTLSYVSEYTQRYLKFKVLVSYLKLLKTQEIPEQFETVLLTTV